MDGGVGGYLLSHVLLFWPPRTVAHKTPLSMGFPKQEYWSGLPFPSLGTLPDPETELRSFAMQSISCFAVSLWTEPPGEPRWWIISNYSAWGDRESSLFSCLISVYVQDQVNEELYIQFKGQHAFEIWTGEFFNTYLLAALGLCCRAQALCCWGRLSLAAVSGGYSLTVVCGLLVAGFFFLQRTAPEA